MVQDKQKLQELLNQGYEYEEAQRVIERSFNPDMKSALVLKAFSIPGEIIEQVLSVDRQELEEASQDQDLGKFYDWVLTKFASAHPDETLERLLPLALRTKQAILQDPKAGAQAKDKVATDIIDRTKGRPAQTLNVKSFQLNAQADLKELQREEEAIDRRIKALEQQTNAGAIDVDSDERNSNES